MRRDEEERVTRREYRGGRQEESRGLRRRVSEVSGTIETEKELTVEKARELLSTAPGVKLLDDFENGIYPMPKESSDQDLVYVGRIRQDISKEGLNSLTLWCAGDQVRKGAATNAIQIAELALEKGLIK